MSAPVFKYLTPEGARRFLKSWALRITPADQFNDPFEMRPLISIDRGSLLKQAPLQVRQSLVEMIIKNYLPGGAEQVTESDAMMAQTFVSYVMKDLSADAEADFLVKVRRQLPGLETKYLSEIQSQIYELYLDGLKKAEARIPEYIQQAERALHDAIPRHIGVLCMSSSAKHPLMWAHYAESHKGVLLEFDSAAPCFNRRRHNTDDLGCLWRVGYSDTRPALRLEGSGEGTFSSLALTKALEWAYEQEQRLLWPLSLADRQVETDIGPIHLIEIPPSALISVTVGCKADKGLVAGVIQQVSDVKEQSAIVIRQALVDEKAFALRYENIQ